MLAVVYALKAFKVYVYGSKNIIIITDHQALTPMIHKTEELASDCQQRWKQLICNFDVTIHYRKGVENQAADALSCHPVNHISDPSKVTDQYNSKWLKQIQTIKSADPQLTAIFAFKEQGLIPQGDKN